MKGPLSSSVWMSRRARIERLRDHPAGGVEADQQLAEARVLPREVVVESRRLSIVEDGGKGGDALKGVVFERLRVAHLDAADPGCHRA